MKLLLRRNQRPAMLGGKPVFTLEVRANVSGDEKSNITKYKLGDTVLYEKSTITDPGNGLLGLASRVAHKAMNISVSVNDLENGKKIDCKDVVELLAVEGQIREAAQTFKAVLDAASHFGGEEVVEL